MILLKSIIGILLLEFHFCGNHSPGTPKVKFRRETPLPPLTPPPPLHSSPARNPSKIHLKSNLIKSFLPKLNVKKSHVQQSSLSSSSSSSSLSSPWSSHSVPSSPFSTPNSREQQSRVSSTWMSLHSRIDEDDYGSTTSTLCFSAGRRSNARSGGCSSRIIKLLLGEFA
ncbi:Elongation factor G like [Abeliophyllum distichum]|uniref:Elongation factor G like n=1 Tax=Abeliophyllum distichum TaxID=126358 RepID=A0ABD1Q5P2_9LAMI